MHKRLQYKWGRVLDVDLKTRPLQLLATLDSPIQCDAIFCEPLLMETKEPEVLRSNDVRRRIPRPRPPTTPDLSHQDNRDQGSQRPIDRSHGKYEQVPRLFPLKTSPRHSPSPEECATPVQICGQLSFLYHALVLAVGQRREQHDRLELLPSGGRASQGRLQLDALPVGLVRANSIHSQLLGLDAIE